MPIDRDTILKALRGCRDPELPVNIVDLGLIYEILINQNSDGAEVQIQMTLTSTGCPMSRTIVADVHRRVMEIPGVSYARVEIAWEPVWHPEMISEEGRRELQNVS